MTNAIALDKYRPQGLKHIGLLSAVVVAGTYFVAWGGALVFVAPLAVGTGVYLFSSAARAKDPDWCESLGEVWSYRLTPGHPSIQDSYEQWCEQWGTEAINNLIAPLIGGCHYANFSKDKRHPYHGLRNVLVFDTEDGSLPPLTPHDYVSARLKEFSQAVARSRQFVAPLTTTRHQEPANPTPIHQQPILVAAEVVEPEPSKVLDTSPTSETVSEPAPTFSRSSTEPGQDVFQFLLSLTQAPLQPTIFVGPPGSGKGTAAAIALRLGKQRNGLNFWVFNPKAQLSEAGYWDEAQHHFLKNRLTCTRIYEDLVEVLDQFAKEAVRRSDNPGQNHPPFVLLLEEINALVGIFATAQKTAFKGKITALASLLRGVNMAVWLSGQSINLEELGLGSRTNRAMFTTIVTVGADREAVVPICELLGVEFDPASLGPAERYWLTSKGTYLAPPAFPVRQYASWSEVTNLVDMRTNTTPQQPQPQTDPDEALWADYQQWKASGGSDRQWKIQRLGDDGGSYHKKLEALKAKFGGSETVSEVVAA